MNEDGEDLVDIISVRAGQYLDEYDLGVWTDWHCALNELVRKYETDLPTRLIAHDLEDLVHGLRKAAGDDAQSSNS